MSDKPETTDDILAKMREEKRPYGVSIDRLRDYADRIEAAVQRERGALVAEAEAAKDARNRVAVRLGVQYAERCRECKAKSGNAAAMREALKETSELVWSSIDPECNNDCCRPLRRIARIADAALAAPARNCDVGTAEEQAKRFRDFCTEHSSIITGMCDGTCPLQDCVDRCHCVCMWAQMPYKEGGAEC